jgi:hypothetical protein
MLAALVGGVSDVRLFSLARVSSTAFRSGGVAAIQSDGAGAGWYGREAAIQSSSVGSNWFGGVGGSKVPGQLPRSPCPGSAGCRLTL